MGKRRITLLVAASLVASLGTGTLGQQVASATPRSPKVATTDYFFHGTPADQANKGTAFANMQPPPADSLTFDTSNTLDATPVTQNNQSPNAGFWPNSLAVYWTGPFSGTINGDVTFNIYWSTSNPEAIALGVDMDVKVIADTDFTSPGAPGPGTIIGEATPTFTFADTTPKLITVTVPVSGAVTNELFIQFASLFSDTGSGLTAYYDNASFPSMFSVPASQVSVSIAGKGRDNVGTPTKKKDDVKLKINLSGTAGQPPTGTFAGYQDGRKNPPGAATTKFKCVNLTATLIDTGGANVGVVSGTLSCAGFASAASFTLTITDNGITGDGYHMTMKDAGSNVVYDWSSTFTSGNVTVTVT